MPSTTFASAAVLLMALSSTASAALGDGLAKGLKAGDEVKDGDPVRVVGKIISQEETDEDGNRVTRALLEQEDGSLIELPCERREDAGVLGKAAGNAFGKDSCWKYLGQEVEVLGDAQKLQRKGKRWLRLGRLTGISPI